MCGSGTRNGIIKSLINNRDVHDRKHKRCSSFEPVSLIWGFLVEQYFTIQKLKSTDQLSTLVSDIKSLVIETTTQE